MDREFFDEIERLTDEVGATASANPWASLAHVARELTSAALSPQKALAKVVETTIRLTRADRGFLMLYDERGDLVVAMARNFKSEALDDEEFRLSMTVVNHTVESKAPVYLPNVKTSSFAGTDSVNELSLLSVMCVPMRVPPDLLAEIGHHAILPTREGLAGVIYVDSADPANLFGGQELEVFQALADHATTALVIARLFQAHLREKDLTQSLELARKVQTGLLPLGVPTFAGLDLAGWSQPCLSAGGDYYDFIPFSDTRLACVVGDVAGHGLGSALVMATARGALLSLVDAVGEPTEVMFRLNNVLRSDAATKLFMTLFYGVIDTGRMTLEYVNAGHEAPILYRPSTGEFPPLSTTGMALGFFGDSTYQMSDPVPLKEGDMLLLYTDGVSEALDPRRERFGRERLKTLLREGREEPAEDVVQLIREALVFHAGEGVLEDDVTVALVKVARSRARAARPLDLVRSGLTALKTRDPARAAETLAKAVALDPKLDSAHFYLGLASLELGDSAKAVEELEETLRLTPDFAGAKRYLDHARERLKP